MIEYKQFKMFTLILLFSPFYNLIIMDRLYLIMTEPLIIRKVLEDKPF